MTYCKMEICTVQEHDELTQTEIAQCAFALYESEGSKHGRDLEHWLQSEKELVASEMITVTKHGERVIVRVPLANIAPTDLVFSVCSKNLMLFQLRHDENGDATWRDFLNVIEFPAAVEECEAEAQLTDDYVILRLPLAGTLSPLARIAQS